MIEYLLVLVVVGLTTFAIQKWFRLQLYKSWKQLILTNLLFFVVGFGWDYFSTSRGHWTYAHSVFQIGVIPVEEILFYFVVPYLVIVLYKIMA